MGVAGDPKRCHSAAHATQFQDASVVAAYAYRPSYPEALFDVLEQLLAGQPRTVLDIGCGTGELSRRLAGRVARIDALDISEPMIAVARRSPGGADPRINWIVGGAEDAPVDPPYGLVTAGQSLHWTDWDVTLPRLATLLAPGAYLAIVEREHASLPWDTEVLTLIQRYSTNHDFVAYNLIDELAARGLFAVAGRHTTAPVRFEQSVDAYSESFHSMNGLSRDRMSGAAAGAFDRGLRRLLEDAGVRESVVLEVSGLVTWGHPGRKT